MKKICFITTISGTINAFLLSFADYLYKSGEYEISFICNYDDVFKRSIESHYNYIPVHMERGISLTSIKAIWEMIRIFKEQKFDIIQYSTPNASFYASIAGAITRIPCRLYCQWGIRYMGFEKGLKRYIFKKIEKNICNKSTEIECESNSLYKFSIDEKLYTKNKACVIGKGSACGISLQKFDIMNKQKWRDVIRNKYHIPQNSFVFGYVGRLTGDKGINELLEAFMMVDEPKAYLLLVGSIDIKESLQEKLIEKAKSNQHIIWAGRHFDVEKYYSAMDTFVSLSYREGFGIVVIEAAAMGVPGIVTNVPGQIDTACNATKKLLVPSKNVSSVVKKMKYCIENRIEIEDMGKMARNYVEQNFEQIKLFSLLKKHRDELISKL